MFADLRDRLTFIGSDTALVHDGQQISGDELIAQAEHIAATTPENSRIGVYLPNGPEFIAAVLGIGLCKSVPIICDPGWGWGQLKAHLSDIGAKACLRSGGAIAEEISRDPRPAPADGLHVMFTSGSSGVPKAVLRTQQTWRASLIRSREIFGLPKHDRVIVPGPLSHGLGLYAAIEAIWNGIPLVTFSRYSDGNVSEALKIGSNAMLTVVPTMIRRLIGNGGANSDVAPGSLVCGGEKLDAKTVSNISRFWPECEVIEYYGSTETGFISVAFASQMSPDSVGRLFPGVAVRTSDDTGQLQVRSDLVASGYLSIDALEPICDAEGWVTTSDIGYLETGVLHLCGRAGDMINSSGYAVAPQMVERALGALVPGQVCVFALPDQLREEVVAAVFTGEPVPTLAQMVDVLPKFMIPRRLFVADTLPMTSSGKTHRCACRELAVAGAFKEIDT